MDYLELQQRANQIVSKVNNYEAGLAKYEITEADILAEHKYADLYTLRAVMNLLFGSTVDQKCDRSLNIPTDLRLFASTVPMWNTTFNLIPKEIASASGGEYSKDITIVGTPDQNDGIVSNFSTSNFIRLNTKLKVGDTLTLKLVNFNPNTNYYQRVISLINNTAAILEIHTNQFYVHNGGASNTITNTNESYVKLTVLSSSSYQVQVGFTESDLSFFNATRSGVDLTSNYLTIGCDTRINYDNLPYQGEIDLSSSKLNDTHLYIVNYDVIGYDYEVKSDKHEFISDIDALNNYNLIHLDALENSVTSRDQRIKQGINYSYSSNIADALVTESQVANMFKWNTTDPNTIPNNTMTLNRQVPGIVVYTIGPDYDKFYTSTIGYNPTQSKFNAVNYGNPSTYGSYYRNDDVKYSQYSHETSTFASEFASCKVFMTGMNYTRGKLESPQQIWQPAEKYGDDNIGYGYNRQGQATYHELVFKNRRKGSGANSVDFTPARSDIPDNDPQGLALRSVLAQQRDFYNGRPWFKELDVLYGANMSKFAANINQSSKLGSSTGSFDRGKFNIIGSPTLSDTGILSNFSSGNYITATIPPINTNSEVEITLPKFNTSNTIIGNSTQILFGFQASTEDNGVQFYIGKVSPTEIAITRLNGNSTLTQSFSIDNLDQVTSLKIINNILYLTINGVDNEIASVNADKTLSTSLVIGQTYENNDTSATIDLSPLRIVVDGVEVFTAKAVGETYMTDQDFYTNYKLSYDTYAESLNQPK